MTPETKRERAEFAARLRLRSPKDPPILTTEAIDDMCAVVLEDARVRWRVIAALKTAMATPSREAHRAFVNAALHMLEDAQ